MPALTIRLPHDAAAALRDLAQVECRTPRDQAAFLVIQGLRHPAPTRHQPRRSRPRPVQASGDTAEAEE
jgi:hypothetical protein